MSQIAKLWLIAIILLGNSAAQAAPITYEAILNGASESPPVSSTGTGFGSIVFDLTAHTLALDITFSGLIGTVTAAHLHCCTAEPDIGNAIVATTTPTLIGFPLAVTAGSYLNTLDLTLASSWNSSFITNNGGTPAGAEAALAAGLDQGRVYLNIHTTFAGSGEIRGFLHESSVPEPASIALMGIGLLGLARHRHQSRKLT